MPVLVGVSVSTVWVGLLSVAASIPLLFWLVAVGDASFGASYPAAGSMISRGAEQVALGQATADAVPYTVLAGLCVLTALVIAGAPGRLGLGRHRGPGRASRTGGG